MRNVVKVMSDDPKSIGSVKRFENRRIRTAWDEENEEWLFSVVDVVEVQLNLCCFLH